ncbi:uncharacterized protein PV09_01499 [Verruconis gallopava]|uniref:chitinase n=1 Tax=Verruconis gallopava TaxID=253628 RepID=A0A0D2ALB4_9PEZI|nr:uncharacterized protein PV09_01499 [Verruconis gallopava]KIW07538.1 hypothetical protein PV09_01499 [Verruconis gallopava]
MYFTSFVSTVLAAASVVSASPHSIKKRYSGSDKVVAYWGNTGYSSGNIDISTICSNKNVDIVILSFLTEFPDQTTNGVPVLNFGNACGDTYSNGLLKCPGIAAGITQCQLAGKEVMLSLGGAYPANQAFASAESAIAFADWLWDNFGSDTSLSTTRPFLTSVIDGIDLDIESNVADDQKQAYFPDFITELRAKSGNTWKISAAPQCVIPDAHFSDYIQSSWFDYIFVQLYNTDGCSASDLVNTPSASTNTFAKWISGALSPLSGYENPDTLVFAGLPASTIASTGTDSGSRFYLTPSQVKELVYQFASSSSFGGISLWDATYDYYNTICDQPYSYWVKTAMQQVAAGNLAPFPSACSVSSASSSSSVASATSSSTTWSSSSVVATTTSSAVVPPSSSSSAGPVIVSSSSSSSSSSPAGPAITSSSSSFSSYFPTVGPYTNSSSSVPITRTGGPRPTSSSGSGSGPVQSSHGSALPSSSVGGQGGHGNSGSSSSAGYGNGGYGNGGYGGGDVSSTSGAHGGHSGHGKPTATKTSTSTYVDVCSTGLTTKTHTWTKTCYEGEDEWSTTTEVPEGWTTTVTVCTVCGAKPTTLTLTTPASTPAWAPAQPTGAGSWPQGGAKVTSTMVVVVTPVPASEYWASVNEAKSTAAAAAAGSSGSWPASNGGSGSGSSPVSNSGSGSGSWPASYGGSSAIAKPVAGSPSNAASWPLGTGSVTGGSYAAQFTGAASRMNVGAGLFAGLAIAALAL